jgi:hypothetical protein
MTQITKTFQDARPRRALIATAVVAVAVAGVIGATQLRLDTSRSPQERPVGAAAAAAVAGPIEGNLHSEYLLEASRAWAPKADAASELHSEYLRTLARTDFRLPTAEQARIRGELHSEYLREAALDW